MVPSFTNVKRQQAYYNAPKQGFNYINWDMEKELYIFQSQIEAKFAQSEVNSIYKFPFVDTIQTKREDSVGQMKPEDLIVLKGVIALQKD